MVPFHSKYGIFKSKYTAEFLCNSCSWTVYLFCAVNKMVRCVCMLFLALCLKNSSLFRTCLLQSSGSKVNFCYNVCVGTGMLWRSSL
jgi:hypothetical protein